MGMKGTVKSVKMINGILIVIIVDSSGEMYRFTDHSLDKTTITTMKDFSSGDEVEFTPGKKSVYGARRDAFKVHLLVTKSEVQTHTTIQESSTIVDNIMPNTQITVQSSFEEETPNVIEYFSPGYSRAMQRDLSLIKDQHLKPNSGESEALDKLSELLYISRIGSFNMGSRNSLYQFCLIGATSLLKQYIRGKYEFLLVFSHFDSEDWQQNTNIAASRIRNLSVVAERRPLVNFYILISNARNLKTEIDKMKGGTSAVIIPLSFEEVLSSDKENLRKLILHRFGEYYFENNMLGEEKPIEEDTLLFGDRGKIADSIVQRCSNHENSGIFGLRRSGKSSVLRAVLRRLENNKIKYVTVESRSIETIDSWRNALYSIARMIRKSVLNIEQGEEESKQEFYRRLMLNSSEAEYQRDAVQCFVDDVKRYTKNEKTFVIAIDEIELITYNTATSPMWKDLISYKGFWSALRDCGCSLIVCGVNSTINEEGTIVFKGTTCDNPMYQRIHLCADFSKTYLPVFTDEQTKIMINTLGSYSNVGFNNVYVDINRAFGGQPYAIRQFCAYMFDRIKEMQNVGEEYQFSKPTFDALKHDFCNSKEGVQLFKTILQHVTIYTEEYEMLKRISHAPEMYNRIEPKDISSIDHLEKYGLIEYDRSTYYISFRINSLKDYIVKMSEKRPEDMDNDERRRFVQDRVALCEKKLKTYILNYYNSLGMTAQGRAIISKIVTANPKAKPIPNSQTCDFIELFDHKKFIMHFSNLRTIIFNNWTQLGRGLNAQGMDKNRFNIAMIDLNAGRTDADHYDPEDMTSPEDWDISMETLKKFEVAYGEFDRLFSALNLKPFGD